MRTMKLEMYFLTHQKPLIRSGTKFSFIKLKNGILGNLLNIATDFIYEQNQRVVLNGKYSSRAATE